MWKEIQSFFTTDPNLAAAIIQTGQWVITAVVALLMICVRLHRNKTMGPGWSLEHCDSSFWRLTRLHDKQAKVLFLAIHHESVKVLTPSGMITGIMNKNDSVILEIPAYFSGNLMLFFAEGRKAKKYVGVMPEADNRLLPGIKNWDGTFWATDKNDESYKTPFAVG